MNGYAVKVDNRSARQARTRKLSMSDVNWYGDKNKPSHPNPLGETSRSSRNSSSRQRGITRPAGRGRGGERGRGHPRGDFGRNSKADMRKPAAALIPGGRHSDQADADDASFDLLYLC